MTARNAAPVRRRGEVRVDIGGEPHVFVTDFAALERIEAELGPLPAVHDRLLNKDQWRVRDIAVILSVGLDDENAGARLVMDAGIAAAGFAALSVLASALFVETDEPPEKKPRAAGRVNRSAAATS